MIRTAVRVTEGAKAHAGTREDDRLRIVPVGDLAELEHAEWDRLAERCGNVFATRDWISTWWEIFGYRGSLMSFACRDRGGSLVALLALYVSSSGPCRELRFLGHREADVPGPVCGPGDRPVVAHALRRVLRDSRTRFDLFVGDDLPEREKWGSAIGARTVQRTSSPVLRGEGRDWEGFLAGQSPNFRQQARRRERRLIRDHDLRYRLAEDPSRLDADFEVLLRLHRARWAGVSKSFASERATFHRAFAAKALERGWLRLWIAELAGRPVAAWYGFRYGGAEWYYQAGRDRRWDALSIGFALLAHTIREALNDGVGEYRLLRGAEPYKLRFANGDEPLETVVLSGASLAAPEERAVVARG